MWEIRSHTTENWRKFVFYHRKNTNFKHLALCLQFIISFIVTSIIKILLNGRFHQITTGLPCQTFRCSRKFSTGTTRRVVFHLLSNRYFRNLLVNGKRPIFSPKLVPLRSLRSSFIDSFSCNTSEGFGAFFVQSCDQFLFPCYLFISFLIFSLFLNFITILLYGRVSKGLEATKKKNLIC